MPGWVSCWAKENTSCSWSKKLCVCVCWLSFPVIQVFLSLTLPKTPLSLHIYYSNFIPTILNNSMFFLKNTSAMLVFTETNKSPFIAGRYRQERQVFFKSRFEGILFFLSHLIDVPVDTKWIITSLGYCSKKSVWLAQRWWWEAGVGGMGTCLLCMVEPC